ncbi:hypothetical protein L0665_01570 [Methanogenium marinum]|uniref:Uncharacterized protein n=1 Tax=Methanogenium marinum TaxID=348610 RepID=A0A9Q4KNJ7_9EURY|nr:hypothetical protein [Methanogenium marinum]MDE4907310.1 hypothetical protein [Methanogenium marinum]
MINITSGNSLICQSNPGKRLAQECQKWLTLSEITNTKSAVRDLTIPIANITIFDALVQDIIDTNPFGCTAYVEQGVPIDPVVRSKEVYDAKVIYENLEADTIGDVSVQVATVAAFGTAATHVVEDNDLAIAIGGTHSPVTTKRIPTPAS